MVRTNTRRPNAGRTTTYLGTPRPIFRPVRSDESDAYGYAYAFRLRRGEGGYLFAGTTDTAPPRRKKSVRVRGV